MARETYKKEKKLHDQLLEMLKKHFVEDEQEILEDDLDEEMKPMPKNMGMKRGKKLGAMTEEDPDMDYEGAEDFYGQDGDDDYFEDLTEEDEDEENEMNLPKEKRKNLAILVISKKAGKKRK